MQEPQAKKPVRYMDFISRKPVANSDPLASRPVSRPTAKPVVKRVSSVADQIPSKSAHREIVQTRVIHHETIQTSVVEPKATPAPAPTPAPKPQSPEITVKRDEMKPFISRQPATTREFYANVPSPEPKKPASLTTRFTDNLSDKTLASDPAPDNNAYSISGKSPFLKHYSVDKRPLSSSVPAKKRDNFEKLSFLGVSDQRDESPRRKNIYKRSESPKKSEHQSKTVRIIDDTDKHSGFPTWAIILITIILGMAVGAGVYYLLPR